VYQTTLPSFFAASMRAGVIALGGGAAALTDAVTTLEAARTVEARSTSRLEKLRIFVFIVLLLS
jgi:hypothetical protein